MEQFDINLIGETLTVYPQADESYQVFRGETLLATLIPNIDEDTGGTTWETYDLISSEYVQQIGELIDEHGR